MTSALERGEGKKADKRKGGCVIVTMTREERGSKIPNILHTSKPCMCSTSQTVNGKW